MAILITERQRAALLRDGSRPEGARVCRLGVFDADGMALNK